MTYGTTYEIHIYIDKFHSKLVYVGLAQARPNNEIHFSNLHYTYNYRASALLLAQEIRLV